MTKTTITGEPLGEEAIKNLHRFKKMFSDRQKEALAEEQKTAMLARKGVKVYTDEEKAAFLAQRNDL